MRNTKTKSIFILMVIMILNLMILGCSSNKFEKEVEVEKAGVKLAREVLAGGYGLVTTYELKKMTDEGAEVLIIDTMPMEDSYKKAHVPGAKPFEFPIPDMEAWDSTKTAGKSQSDFETLLGSDKNKTIVIYCGFVKCTRSHNGAIWAKKMGYPKVYRYPGGIFAWKGAGFPVETGE